MTFLTASFILDADEQDMGPESPAAATGEKAVYVPTDPQLSRGTVVFCPYSGKLF